MVYQHLQNRRALADKAAELSRAKARLRQVEEAQVRAQLLKQGRFLREILHHAERSLGARGRAPSEQAKAVIEFAQKCTAMDVSAIDVAAMGPLSQSAAASLNAFEQYRAVSLPALDPDFVERATRPDAPSVPEALWTSLVFLKDQTERLLVEIDDLLTGVAALPE
jgi:hypothetical protein